MTRTKYSTTDAHTALRYDIRATMAHVFLPSGRDLRLRLYPKPRGIVRAPAPAAQPLALFGAPVDDDSQDTAQERLAAKIASLALMNRVNAAILERTPELGLRDWWLV